jgi:hypothetical protein
LFEVLLQLKGHRLLRLEVGHTVLVGHNFSEKDVSVGKLFGGVINSLQMLIVLTVEVVDGWRDEEFDVNGRWRWRGFLGGRKMEFGGTMFGKVG